MHVPTLLIFKANSDSLIRRSLEYLLRLVRVVFKGWGGFLVVAPLFDLLDLNLISCMRGSDYTVDHTMRARFPWLLRWWGVDLEYQGMLQIPRPRALREDTGRIS